MSDVFISYARSTAAEAKLVAEALRGLGYVVWRDDELPAHRAYAEVIEQRLDAAKAVVVLWSADAAKSQWVRSEADRARGAAKLVQLTLDGARLPMPFDQIQCADLANWHGDTNHLGWRKVVASVADLLETDGSPPTPAPGGAAPHAEPLLAVLAFENPSGEEETAYFSDGVSQEILDTVARSSGMKVIGRASSFQLRGEAKAPARVAAELRATHVLDGSVRRAGARVRISAELCRCDDGRSLWSERFDREMSDIFAVQDEIAGAVAHALKVVFAPAETAAITLSPQAYELYLKSRDLGRRITSTDRAALVERALVLSPDFPQAWGWLALMRARVAVLERGDAAFGPLEQRAREAMTRAQALGLATGITKAAAAQLEPFAAFARREALLDEALGAAASDPVLLIEKSRLLSSVGLFSDALVAGRLAKALDPNLLEASNRCAILPLLLGDWEAGQAACDDLRARWSSDSSGGVTFAAPAAAHAGDWAKLDEVVAFAATQDWQPAERAARITTNLMFSQAMRTQDEGFANLVAAVAEGELTTRGAPAMEKLYALGALGRVDTAFALVERASYSPMFEPGTFYMADGYDIDYLCSTSHNLAMIEDPRFVGLCAKIGLADYWLSKNRWPACADRTAYDFRAEARRLVGV